MDQIGVVDLLKLCGLDQTKPTKLVRHQQAEYPVEELLQSGWLELYQSYQGQHRFHRTDYIVSFTALPRGRALFFGVFRNKGVLSVQDGPCPDECPWVKEWRAQCKYYYELERVPGFEALEGRMVIDWGSGALAWHQHLRNKPVVELLAPGRRLAPFDDYLTFSLTFEELKTLVNHPEAHQEWRAHLQAVAGVYLILASTTGNCMWVVLMGLAASGHGGPPTSRPGMVAMRNSDSCSSPTLPILEPFGCRSFRSFPSH